MEALVQCPKCTTPIKENAQFCEVCEPKVSEDERQELQIPPDDLEKWELISENGAALFRDPVSGRTWIPSPPPSSVNYDDIDDLSSGPPALPPQDPPMMDFEDEETSEDVTTSMIFDDFNNVFSRRRGGWSVENHSTLERTSIGEELIPASDMIHRTSSQFSGNRSSSEGGAVAEENTRDSEESNRGSEENNNNSNNNANNNVTSNNNRTSFDQRSSIASDKSVDSVVSNNSTSTLTSSSTTPSSPESHYHLWLTSNNIHAIAASLDVFFKDLFALKPHLWIAPIKNKLIFLLMSRPSMADAFLYGERSPIALENGYSSGQKRMQDWLRWVMPLFSPPLEGDSAETDFAESAVPLLAPGPLDNNAPPPSPASANTGRENEHAISPAKTLEKQAILITVTLLHQAFREGNPERWSSQLAHFLSRMQGLGWNETNANRVRDIFKAVLTKIENVDALSLKRNFEHPCWDSLLVLVSAIEEFCYLTPLYGFQVQPEPGTVGVHLDSFGCSDRDLLVLCNELLNTKLAVGSESIAPGVIRDSKDAKDYKKRKDQLVAAGQFAACASKWAEIFSTTVDQAIRNPIENSKMTPRKHLAQFETKDSSPAFGVTPAYEKITGELLEYLSKRKGFRKKQATYMLHQSIELCRQRHSSTSNKSSKSHKQSLSSNKSGKESVSRPQKESIQISSNGDQELSWAELSPEAVYEQTKAGTYNLRRTIRFLTHATKTQEEFVIASNKAMYKEVKKAYFCPGFDAPPNMPEDGIPSIMEASASILNLTNAFTLRVQNFVEEVSAEVLAPLVELQTAYDESSALFQQQWQSTEKIIETERTRLLKEFEGVERDVAELNLVSFEYEEAKKISSMAEKKAAQKKAIMAQRTAIRVQKYEKASTHFDSYFLPSTLKLLYAHITSMQKMERRRLRCSKLYLNRYLAAFARFSGAYSPKFELSTAAVVGLDDVRDMNRFSTNTKRQPVLPALPQLATTSAIILESVPIDAAPLVLNCENCGNPTDSLTDACTTCGQAGKNTDDKDQQLTVHFETYMEEQGYPDSARAKMRVLPSSHKLALLAAAQNSKKDSEAKSQKQDLPAYWSKILSVPNKVTSAHLKNFKIVITSKGTKKWLQDFAAAAGLEHLLAFLEFKGDATTIPLKHEALACLVTIMKNKVGLQIVSKVAAACLASIVSSSDYVRSDRLIILELLTQIAASEDGRKPVLLAFERNMEVLVNFCAPIDKCQKCSLELQPYALACKGCDFSTDVALPLASLTLINQILQALKDKDTATGYQIILEEFGLSKIRKNFRTYCQFFTPLMAQCDLFDALVAKIQDLPSRADHHRTPSRPLSLQKQPPPPPSAAAVPPSPSVRKIDVLGKMKLGFAKAKAVASPKPQSNKSASPKDDSSRSSFHGRRLKTCECGAEVFSDDVFCTECGTTVSPHSPVMSSATPPVHPLLSPPPPPLASSSSPVLSSIPPNPAPPPPPPAT